MASTVLSTVRKDMGDWTTTELGEVFFLPETFGKKFGNQWDVARKLSSSRVISLLAVSQLVEEFRGIGMTAIACCDAVPSLGIAGLLWRKYLGENVNVTINVKDCDAELAIADNARRVGLADGNVSFVKQDTNVLLHSDKKYNFVYLECYGPAVCYLEAACHAVCHRGIICIVSTDLSTLYNKSPDRVRRIYGGMTMKVEYMKELAVRLIVASAIRSAARWNRGIEVLFSHVDESAITVVVRVLKGATHADRCLDNVQKIAHCRVCNYRCFIPEKLYYHHQPEILDCLCVKSTPFNTQPPIVMLGPAYAGPIFTVMHTISMLKTLTRTDPKHRLLEVLKVIVAESICSSSDNEETEFMKAIADVAFQKNTNESEPEGPPCKKKKEMIELSMKRPIADHPAFFYVGQTHTKKGFNPPKMQAIIHKLHLNGFKASKTMFDSRGVRTSATTKEFSLVLDEISQQVT